MDLDLKFFFFVSVGLICILFALAVKNKARFFIILLSLFYVFPTGFIFYHYSGLMLADFPMFALVAMGLYSGKFKFYVPYFSTAFLAIIVWGFFASFGTIEPGWAITEVTIFIRAYLVFLCIVSFVRTPKDLNIVLFTVLFGFLFQTALGVHQWRWGPVGLWFLGERIYRISWRSMGTFFVPSYYGNYILFLLPLFYRLFLFYRPAKKYLTYILGCAVVFGVVALYSAYARGPWISLIISLSIMTLISLFKRKYRPRIRWAIVFLIVFGTIFTLKYSSKIVGQFGSARQGSADIRKDQWRTAFRVIRARPLFGTGFENYELVADNYVTPEEKMLVHGWQFSEMVHNSYLYMTAQIGVPGGFFFLLLLIFIFRRAFGHLRSPVPLVSNVAIGITTGFLGMCLSYVYSPDIHSYQHVVQFCLLSGMVYSLSQVELSARPRKSRKPHAKGRNIANKQMESAQISEHAPESRIVHLKTRSG